MASYRFKVTSKINSTTLGTGCFKASKQMTPNEQLNFLHQYTHGMYLDKDSFLSIEIKEVTEAQPSSIK